MTVERRLGYSEAKQKGANVFKALKGVWVEAKPGATNGVVTVLDEDTVQVRENILPLSHTAWPIDSIETYRGAAIGQLPGLRWRGDPQQVKSSVTRDSEVYIPEDHRERLAASDRAYLRKHYPRDF